MCGWECVNVQRVAAKPCRTKRWGDGCDCRSQLHIMPQTKLLTRCHTTVQIQLWCSMSPLSGTKQTTSIHLRIDMKRMQHFAFRLRIVIPVHKSRNTMNMNYNILFQWELFHCHKFFTLWLNVTHLWALFHPSFCCLVHCSKTALMPFSLLYRHFLCAILAPCFVVFSSPPYRRDTLPQKKNKKKETPTMSPWAVGIVPSASMNEDEQCCYE